MYFFPPPPCFLLCKGIVESWPEPQLNTWVKHLDSHRSTDEGNSPVWQEGVEPGSTSPRPHLRADCHCRRILFWGFLLCGVFSLNLDFFLDVSEYSFPVCFFFYFHHNNLSSCSTNCNSFQLSYWTTVQHKIIKVIMHSVIVPFMRA